MKKQKVHALLAATAILTAVSVIPVQAEGGTIVGFKADGAEVPACVLSSEEGDLPEFLNRLYLRHFSLCLPDAENLDTELSDDAASDVSESEALDAEETETQDANESGTADVDETATQDAEETEAQDAEESGSADAEASETQDTGETEASGTEETMDTGETEASETETMDAGEAEASDASGATGTPGDSSFAAQVVALVNQERAQQGLGALTVDSGLASAAMVRAQEIATSFSHTRPNGSAFATALDELGVSYQAAGENLAQGQGTAAEIVNAWMNSEGHRANILNGEFTRIGIASYQTADGNLYCAQLFAF